MSRDYKPQMSSGSGGRNSGGLNPLFMGMIIGLLMGVAIALGVALWLNKSAIPFMEKVDKPKAVEPMKTEAKPDKPTGKTDTKAEPAKPGDAAKTPDKPRFEFYQILPGDKDGSKPAKKSEEAKPAAKTEKPADKGGEKLIEKAAGSTREVYYLQAGAFQNLAEADNLKAKIALVGLSASVTATQVPEKGVLHRVRLGPYQSIEAVNRIKAALSDNGISAAVVKTTDVLN